MNPPMMASSCYHEITRTYLPRTSARSEPAREILVYRLDLFSVVQRLFSFRYEHSPHFTVQRATAKDIVATLSRGIEFLDGNDYALVFIGQDIRGISLRDLRKSDVAACAAFEHFIGEFVAMLLSSPLRHQCKWFRTSMFEMSPACFEHLVPVIERIEYFTGQFCGGRHKSALQEWGVDNHTQPNMDGLLLFLCKHCRELSFLYLKGVLLSPEGVVMLAQNQHIWSYFSDLTHLVLEMAKFLSEGVVDEFLMLEEIRADCAEQEGRVEDEIDAFFHAPDLARSPTQSPGEDIYRLSDDCSLFLSFLRTKLDTSVIK